MRNRSAEYLTRRGAALERRRTEEQKDVERLFSKMGTELSSLKNLIAEVEKECVLYCAPSFSSKHKIAARIEDLRYRVALSITRAKGLMEEFSRVYQRALNPSLVESVRVHFHYKLDILVSRMGASLCKIEASKGLGTAPEDLSFAHNDKASVEGVYKSVYFISSVIRELKGVVLSQSEKIERLDSAMDFVSYSAKKSSKEISSISTFGSQVKSRIITVLFFSIFVLVLLSALKAYTHAK